MSFENFTKTALIIVCVALLAAVGLPIYKSVVADGKVTYCYVEYWSPSEMPPMVRLHGFRPWRTDRFIGNYRDLPEAAKAAETIGCKIEGQ